MKRTWIMISSVLGTLFAIALVVAGTGGMHRLEEQRRNLARLEIKRDAAKRKTLEFERKIASQSEGLGSDALFSPHREKLVREELGVIAEDEIEVLLK